MIEDSLLEAKDSFKIDKAIKESISISKGYVNPFIELKQLNEYYIRFKVFDYKEMYFNIDRDNFEIIGFTIDYSTSSTSSYLTINCISKIDDKYIEGIKKIINNMKVFFGEIEKVIIYVQENDFRTVDILRKIGFEKEIFLPNELGIDKGVFIYSYFFNNLKEEIE